MISKCISKAKLIRFLVAFLPWVTPWLYICHEGIVVNRSIFLFWEKMQLWKSQCCFFFRLPGVTLLWQMKEGYVGSGEKKQSCVGRSSSCCEASPVNFLCLGKKFSRNNFCIKCVFQHLYSLSQCFYHYHSWILYPNSSWLSLQNKNTCFCMCLQKLGQGNTFLILFGRSVKDLSFLPLLCIQLCVLWLFVQLTYLYIQTKEET